MGTCTARGGIRDHHASVGADDGATMRRNAASRFQARHARRRMDPCQRHAPNTPYRSSSVTDTKTNAHSERRQRRSSMSTRSNFAESMWPASFAETFRKKPNSRAIPARIADGFAFAETGRTCAATRQPYQGLRYGQRSQRARTGKGSARSRRRFTHDSRGPHDPRRGDMGHNARLRRSRTRRIGGLRRHEHGTHV